MEKKVLNEMFDNLLHIGNKTNFWNPKMKRYIYGSVNGIHVINLVKTEEQIQKVSKELEELHKSGKKILFVGTKLQARDAVAKIASESGHYYVSEKWVPGLLTNFKTIKRRIATYLQLSKDSKTWALDMLTKKEKAAKILELEKLEKAYIWVKDMKKIPDVVFVIDGVYEEQAITEAKSLNLISYAILSTNWDDTIVDNCIPANTNAVTSIEYVLSRLVGALSAKVVASQWPKWNNTWNQNNTVKFKKIEDKKVIGEKTTSPKKEAEVKVEKEEIKEKKATPKKEVAKKEEK